MTNDEDSPRQSPHQIAENARVEQELASWRNLLEQSFYGDRLIPGASPATLLRLLSKLADADALLTRLVGHGIVSLGIYASKSGIRQVAADSRVAGDPTAQAAIAYGRELAEQPPTPPLVLLVAMRLWMGGKTFTPEDFQRIIAEINTNTVTSAQLLGSLGLLGDPRESVTPREIAADLGAALLERIFHRYPTGSMDSAWVTRLLESARADPDFAVLCSSPQK